jgi:hypothetical protein
MASTEGAGRRDLGVLTGALFALLWIVGTVLQGVGSTGPFPQPTTKMGDVQAYFAASAEGAKINGGVQIVAGIALVWFAGIMAGFLRRRGRRDAAPAVVLAGGAIAAATLLLSAGAIVSLAGSDLVSDAPVAQALYQLSFWFGGPLHVAALGTMIAASAYALGGVLPKWVTIVGLVVGAAGVLSSLTVVLPPAVILTPIGRFLGLIWLLIVTITLSLKRSADAPAAATSSV